MHADLAVLPRVTPEEFNEQENAPGSYTSGVCAPRANEPRSMRKYRSRVRTRWAFTRPHSPFSLFFPFFFLLLFSIPSEWERNFIPYLIALGTQRSRKHI